MSNKNIVRVKHVRAYLLEVWFNDGTTKQVNFANFLFSTDNPLMTKYRDVALFKRARVRNGDISWGRNDMDISGSEVATGEIRGRKLYSVAGKSIWAYSMKEAKTLSGFMEMA